MLGRGLRFSHPQSGRLEFVYIGMTLRALAQKHDTELQSFWTTCTIRVKGIDEPVASEYTAHFGVLTVLSRIRRSDQGKIQMMNLLR